MVHLRKSLIRFWKRNKLPIVFCAFGTFWCGLAVFMILMYTKLIESHHVTDMPFNQPAPRLSPCVGHFCPFHATCQVKVSGSIETPHCVCIVDCSDFLHSPVCGTNHITYDNECELKKASCHLQRRIKVLHHGECHDPCDGVTCSGQQVCRLNDQREPVCMCDGNCEQTVAPVCGSDGRTYSNECMLRQEACRTGREITVLYAAECNGYKVDAFQESESHFEENPCSTLNCGPNRDCSIDRQGKATCVCPSHCERVIRPVCGDDGQQYDNLCELRSYGCRTDTPIAVAHDGPCENQGPCEGEVCEYDADCVVHGGNPYCECPVCSEEYDPVCGNNGISYENDCKMRRENCKLRQRTRVEHKGLCLTSGCDKNSNVCQFYSVCHSDGVTSRCVCPPDCQPNEAKVCGTDGVTYKHECELRVTSCMKQERILISSFGECEDCNGVQCKFGAKCVNNVCGCPVVCPFDYQPVCASNGKKYNNKCEMDKEACQRGIELSVVWDRQCEDDPLDLDSSEGSGSGSLECDDNVCQFGGTCHLDQDGYYKCHCSFSCDAVRSPVCGTDGKLYGNKCELQAAACEQQREILIQSSDNCDEIEEGLCDGKEPVRSNITGEEISCEKGSDCPANSYCHLQYRRCCNEERLSDMYISDCSETPYGCCSDFLTPATGPLQAGCPDQCNCYLAGSTGASCDPVTKQCSCKAGVGGTRCDLCLPKYWGLHLIEQHKNAGCIPCSCHSVGATRPDCHQMTGRCICRENYEGLKCDRCKNSKGLAGPHGCDDEARSCREMRCYFGATCRDTLSVPECICEISCDDYPASGYVCGSNNITYKNECNMKRDSCRLQREIYVLRLGSCVVEPTTSPFTPQSRKTTRHINPVSSVMTDKVLSKATVRPPVVHKSRIGDLCLDNSYCDIQNSHCRFALCKCDDGFIPTFENTQCSEVATQPSETLVFPDNNITACTLNPCHNRGVCELDDSLGYRCLCALGRSGTTCKKATTFRTPSFSGTSYLILRSLGNISGDFYLEIVFHSMNRDGILLFSSQYSDGTGQFVSIAINNGHVEYRFDMGNGPLQIRHPHPISQDGYHQVIAKKLGLSSMLIIDDTEPVTVLSAGAPKYFDLSGKLYLGNLPQNMSFIMEKISMNMGFVGCIRSLTAGHMDLAQLYNLEYPNPSSHIVDGLDVGPCHKNPCQSLPCLNGGTCVMLGVNVYECLCLKGYTGNTCDAAVDLCTHSPCYDGATCSISHEEKIICRCPADREGEFCEYEKLEEIQVPEFYGNGFLMLPLKEIMARHMSVEIWFKTSARNGVLLISSQYIEGIGDFISLNIVDLRLEFRFDLGDGLVIIRSTESLVLDKWHRVTIQRTKRDAELVLDGGIPVKGHSQGSLQELQLSGTLLLGGYKDKFDVPIDSSVEYNFTGVIQRLYLNGRLTENPIESALEQRNVHVYSGPPCNVNPCLNGGVCVPRLENADCRCPKRYIGERCEKMADSQDKNLPVKFTGQTFLQYYNEITIAQQAQRKNKFSFRFRTELERGLLLYQNQGHTVTGDYIAIVINSGYIELSYNLGKQSAGNLFQIRSTVYVSDNNWHTVQAERDRRSATLQVDQESIQSGQSDSGATLLDTDGMLWIGGKMDIPLGLPHYYYPGFVGCLGDIYINDMPLHLFDSRHGQTNTIEEVCH